MPDIKRPWSAPQIFWSAFIAMVAWSAIGFSWFGPGFGWATQGRAEEMQLTAVTESLANICVAQARGAPDSLTALKQFGELTQWKQGEFVAAAHWATMPGSETAEKGVADLCAVKLRTT